MWSHQEAWNEKQQNNQDLRINAWRSKIVARFCKNLAETVNLWTLLTCVKIKTAIIFTQEGIKMLRNNYHLTVNEFWRTWLPTVSTVNDWEIILSAKFCSLNWFFFIKLEKCNLIVHTIFKPSYLQCSYFRQEAESLSKECNMKLYRTSVKNDLNVGVVFHY